MNSTGSAGIPASPPLPAWALAFQEGAEAMSTMLREEDKARGVRS